MIDIRLLGPLEIQDDRGRKVALTGGKPRALLVLLSLRPGELLASDRLIEDLWPGLRPRSALPVTVSRLRKALGADVIRSVSPGYVLDLSPEAVDAGRFERLFGEGRQALARGDAARAAAMLREALELWRGPALADVRYETFAQAAIGRLEELRLACLEVRIEADLALGCDAELVPELDALVAAEPLRERFRAQLMLALYRSGRQAEALAVYQETAPASRGGARDRAGTRPTGAPPGRPLPGRAAPRAGGGAGEGATAGRASARSGGSALGVRARHAQDGHGPLRRSRGLDGARRAPRPGGLAANPVAVLRSGTCGPRAPRRRGREVHRRRRHGRLRPPGGPRGRPASRRPGRPRDA